MPSDMVIPLAVIGLSFLGFVVLALHELNRRRAKESLDSTESAPFGPSDDSKPVPEALSPGVTPSGLSAQSAVASASESRATIPLFLRNGFGWVMGYFLLSTFLLFFRARAPSLGMTPELTFGLVAHVVAVCALLTRRRWGLYVAYAFLGGRSLVGLVSGAPPQAYGIDELLVNWAGWGIAVAAPIAALVWLAINSHYFGPSRK